MLLVISFIHRLWNNGWLGASEYLEKSSFNSFRALRVLRLIVQSPRYVVISLLHLLLLFVRVFITCFSSRRFCYRLCACCRFRVFTETFVQTSYVLGIVTVLVGALIYMWAMIGMEVFNTTFSAVRAALFVSCSFLSVVVLILSFCSLVLFLIGHRCMDQPTHVHFDNFAPPFLEFSKC